MAKVIGKDQKKVKRVSCNHCAARVAYPDGEVQEVNGRDYGGGPDGHKFILCPACGKKIILESW